MRFSNIKLSTSAIAVALLHISVASASPDVGKISTSVGGGEDKDTFFVGDAINFKLKYDGLFGLPETGHLPLPSSRNLQHNVGWNFGDGCSYSWRRQFAPDLVNYYAWLFDYTAPCRSTSFTHWNAGSQRSATSVSHAYSNPGTYTIYADYVVTGVYLEKYDYPTPYYGFDEKIITIVPVRSSPPVETSPSLGAIIPIITEFILD